ncbi:MAG: hypothetical protein JWM89_1778 [Acidimicrobiales bacterium]|nr:hypothetical protein [Acidimicrobiales bacterium]
MEHPDGPDMLEQAAEEIDTVVGHVADGIRTGVEGVDAVGRIVAQYLGCVPAEPVEVELLLDYALEAAASISADPLVQDPVLVDYAAEVVGGVRAEPQLRAHFSMLIDRLDVAVRLGDAGSVDELVELCREGRRSHRHLLGLAEAAEDLLHLAHRLELPEALAAAARPAPGAEARLGHHHWSREQFVLALDLLAHLAADPYSDAGVRARAELVELVAFVETAGEAAVRLPVHLLTEEERTRLLSIHESRVDLFVADPLQVPVHLAILRDNRVVRAALWQALDASRI